MNIYALEARSKLISEMKKLNADEGLIKKGLSMIDAIYREIPTADSDAVVLSLMRYLCDSTEKRERFAYRTGIREWEESELLLPVISKIDGMSSKN